MARMVLAREPLTMTWKRGWSELCSNAARRHAREGVPRRPPGQRAATCAAGVGNSPKVARRMRAARVAVAVPARQRERGALAQWSSRRAGAHGLGALVAAPLGSDDDGGGLAEQGNSRSGLMSL